MGKVLISTLYEGKAVKAILGKLSLDKIIFIVDEQKTEDAKKKLKNSLEEIKKFYSEIIEIETIKVNTYDLQQTIRSISDVIDKESKLGNEIIAHLTEGRKTGSLAMLFAVYLKKDKVKAAYYVTEEENKMISLPLVTLDVGESKKKLLIEIERGNGAVSRLEQKMKIKPSAIYQHIQELKHEGYLEKEKELKLTDVGKVMVL